MAMTITKLRKQYAALLEHQNELNGKLLLANQYAGFRGSRGVLEAEQARGFKSFVIQSSSKSNANRDKKYRRFV